MAILRGHQPDREVSLPPRCLIGRSRACDLVIAGRNVSSEHAVLEWNGSVWQLRDLGSRNGTFLDGRRLAAGEQCPVSRGAEIRLGRQATPWVLSDDTAPMLMAVKLATGECAVGAWGYLALPDASHPELGICQTDQGAWTAECRNESFPVEDRGIVTTPDGSAWRVYLPLGIEHTLKDDGGPVLLEQLALRFAFTRDEEHVELTVHAQGASHELKARAHHYPLLVLARQRLTDQRAGVPLSEQGWTYIEDLLKMLKIDDNHLNISIHRARLQLSALGVVDAVGLVERRSLKRQIRLGVGRIELVPLDADSPQ